MMASRNLADTPREPFGSARNPADTPREPFGSARNPADTPREPFGSARNLADTPGGTFGSPRSPLEGALSRPAPQTGRRSAGRGGINPTRPGERGAPSARRSDSSSPRDTACPNRSSRSRRSPCHWATTTSSCRRSRHR